MRGREYIMMDMNTTDKVYYNATLFAIQNLINISKNTIITIDIIKQEWKKAVSKYTNLESYTKKGCPKNTFLGLCFSGKIKGLNVSPITINSKNANYGLIMLKTLQNNLIQELEDNQKEFWMYHVKHYNFPKTPNHQYIIVKALYDNGYIEY